MNKLLGLIVAFLMVCSPAVFAEESATTTTTTEEAVEAGTTPDSPLWGLEKAMERLSMLITLGKAAKAKKGLMHARERLAEVKAMIEAKKLDKAAKAQKAHEEGMAEVEENINVISEDPEEELDSEVDVEKEIAMHDAELSDVEETADTEIQGTLTEEQKDELDSVVNSLEADAEKVRSKMDAKRENTRIKLKTKLGKTDAEVDAQEAKIAKEANLQKLTEKIIAQSTVRLERKIAKLRNLAEKAKEKGKDVSALEQRLNEAETLLNQVKDSKDKSLKELREAVHEINKLLNFRGVFIALQAKNMEARLEKIQAKGEAIKARIEANIEEAREVKERAIKESAEEPEESS